MHSMKLFSLYPFISRNIIEIVCHCNIYTSRIIWWRIGFRHLLNPMHIKENLTDSLLRTMVNVLGTKQDSFKLWIELKVQGRMVPLHLKEVGLDDKVTMKYKWVEFPWVWNKEEQKVFWKVFKGLKTSSRDGASLRNKSKDERIMGLITHDYHNILRHVLPIGLKKTFKKHASLKGSIYRLNAHFQWICQPEIKTKKFQK